MANTYLWFSSPANLILLGWATLTTLVVIYLIFGRNRERVKQSHLQALVDSIPDLTWIKDQQSRFLLVNRQFSRAFGKSPNSLIGLTDLDLSSEAQAIRYLEDDKRVMRERTVFTKEEQITGVDGQVAWAETIKVPVYSDSGEVIGTAGMARDITERKRSEERINFLAHHDYLTGLSNRLDFEQQCESILAGFDETWQAALIFIDLDNFKTINDTLGHRVGDSVLKSLAARLEANLADRGWIARFGGDEFVIFMPELESGDTCSKQIEATMDTIREPIEVAGLRFELTASMGVSRFPEDAKTYEDLLRCADLAMYQAKNNKSNQVSYFESSMADKSRFRLSIRQELQRALQENHFFLEYQPKVDFRNMTIVGLEALVRWRHPSLGVLPPSEFILLAEHTGQIMALGDKVIELALQQIASWRADGKRIPRLSINLSAVQLHAKDFNQRVCALLHEYKVPGELLEFELTESILMDHNLQVSQTLSSFQEQGIAISIDDFGTGYSSLAYLSRLPVDILKIDRSFVDHIDSRPDQQAITRAIIQLAQALKLDVIAEGIERIEEAEYLLAQNASQMQGYYFSRPLTSEALEEFGLWRETQALISSQA